MSEGVVKATVDWLETSSAEEEKEVLAALESINSALQFVHEIYLTRWYVAGQIPVAAQEAERTLRLLKLNNPLIGEAKLWCFARFRLACAAFLHSYIFSQKVAAKAAQMQFTRVYCATIR